MRGMLGVIALALVLAGCALSGSGASPTDSRVPINTIAKPAGCASLVGKKATGIEQAERACADVLYSDEHFPCHTKPGEVLWLGTADAAYEAVTDGVWKKYPVSVGDNFTAMAAAVGCL